MGVKPDAVDGSLTGVKPEGAVGPPTGVNPEDAVGPLTGVNPEDAVGPLTGVNPLGEALLADRLNWPPFATGVRPPRGDSESAFGAGRGATASFGVKLVHDGIARMDVQWGQRPFLPAVWPGVRTSSPQLGQLN